MKRIICFWICTTLIVGCNYKKPSKLSSTIKPDSLTYKINKIFEVWDNPNTPGGSVAIIKEGKVIFIDGYGCADLEMSTPLTKETKLFPSSISKQFTGYCIAQLIREGKLSLEDDIMEIIPELSSIKVPVRVKDLVYQKSGLRDYLGLMPIMGFSLNDYFSNDIVLNILQNQKELNFAPGERWEYSNTNYFLLAEIIKRVTGESFKHWTEKRIFKPLQMSNTFFVDSFETLIPNRAKSYRQNRDGSFINDPFLDVSVGHMGLYSTAEDMVNWLLHLREMNKNEDPLFKLMLQPDKLNSGAELDSYSFGLFKSSGNYGQQYWHRGSLFGYKSIISYYPDLDFGFVMLGNVMQFNRIRYAREVMQLFYPETSVTTSVNQGTFSIDDSLKNSNIRLEQKYLEKYAGKYVAGPMEVFVITHNGDSLTFGEFNGSRVNRLVNVARNTFRDQESTFLIKFHENSQGTIDSLEYQSETDSFTGQFATRLSNYKEEEVMGEYYSDELDVTVAIIRDPKGLIVKNVRLGNIELVPTYNDEFRCGHDFFSYVRFFRNNKNHIEGFMLDGFTVTNLRFRKK